MAKQPSLAAQSGALQGSFTMPAVFQAPPEPIVARYIAPYITFAHPKRADEWGRLAAKFGDVQEGSMYFVTQKRLEKLDPAKVSMLCWKQWWGRANASGELLEVSFKELPKPFKEHVTAVVLLYLDDCVLPANVEFRSTKCPAAKTLSDALVEACTPEWAEKSAAHKATLVCEQPFMRVFGLVSLGVQRISKTGEGAGMPYRTTTCRVQPTGVQEWQLLKKLCEDEETNKLMADAARRFEERLAEINSKVK